MGNITKRQIKCLLRRVQRCQLVDGGKHKVGIQVFEGDTKDKFWFSCVCEIGGKYYWGECYDWRTYEENGEVIDKFIDLINNN